MNNSNNNIKINYIRRTAKKLKKNSRLCINTYEDTITYKNTLLIITANKKIIYY